MRSVLATLAFSGCSSPVAEEDYPFLSNAVGTVTLSSETYIIQVERPRETVVVPRGMLPASFRRNGLRVEFSGELLPIPPNVRLIGSPIEITRIARAD